MKKKPVKKPPQEKNSWRRRLLRVSAGVFAVLLLAALACYHYPRQVLTVDSGPVKADVMVVLGGGYRERAERAAELFKQGAAPKIIVSGTGDCNYNEHLLKTNGVPVSAIILECKSRTTRENAEFSIALLRQMHAHRVIIVTSWYHSRRALACFGHFAPDMKFYSRPSYVGYVEDDWARRYVNGFVKSEYVKSLGYWIRYGICPF